METAEPGSGVESTAGGPGGFGIISQFGEKPPGMVSFGPPEAWAAENGLSDRALRGWAAAGFGGNPCIPCYAFFGGPWARSYLASCSTLAWQTRSCAWEAGRRDVSTEKSQGMCGLQPKD